MTIVELHERGNKFGAEIAEMSSIELSSLCDVVFRKNPKIAEFIAWDLQTRAMDKALCEAELEGEFHE
jgi:hypothetical protein